MLISVSLDVSKTNTVRFREVEVNTMREVGQIMLRNYNWSPIVWDNGYRLKKNFKSCDLLVLDFDDGTPTLEDFTAEMREEKIKFIIGTTKSHQKEKNGVIADRFRAVMQFCDTITDLKTYEQNMDRIISAYGCDPACRDGARYFFPCKQIIAWGDGDHVPFLPYEAPPTPTPTMRAQHGIMRAMGALPKWVHDALATYDPGNQHAKIFRVAANLVKYGVSEAEIIRMIADCNWPTETTQEKERVARNGIRAAKEGA